MRVRDAMAALDGAIARHRRVVLVLWLVVVAAAVPFALRQGDHLTGGGFKVAGSDSAEVEEQLQRQVDANHRQVVMAAVMVRGRDEQPGAVRAAVADLERATRAVKGVDLRATPADAVRFVDSQPVGSPAILPMTVSADEYHAPDVATDLREQLALADGYDRGGVTMHLVGQGALWAGMVDLTKDDLADAERVGFPVVLVILLLVFGSLTAALLPLALGVAAIALTGAVIYALSTATVMNVYSTNMASMIGIGVAVDYSLFVVVRYREELRAGRSPDEARRTALTTSGVAIVFSGLTVIVALASLFVIDTAALRSLAAGAIVVVAIAVLLTATLLPALLGALGKRISPEPQRGGRWWASWAERVMSRPRLFLAGSALVLVALALPALGLTLGDGALRQFPPGNETRTGFEIGSKMMAPGEGAPLKVLAPRAQVKETMDTLRRDPEAKTVLSRATTSDDTRLVVIAVPRHDPDSEQAKAFVERMRATLPAGVLVGGNSAAQLDFDDEVLDSLPLVVALILVFSFVALAALLRSVVLPIKAILTNLLSVAAAFGVLTIVYVWGWTDGLFGWESPGYVDTFTVPLIIAAVFGLSMDYEVFLLSRIRERYEIGGDTRRAVGEALTSSARTITGAALIMVAVFGVFIGTGVPAIQQVGLGCAVAIALDATLVRLVLVPAAMVVLGRWNWWWPQRGAAKAVAVGLLMVLVLAGCGGGDDSKSTSAGGSGQQAGDGAGSGGSGANGSGDGSGANGSGDGGGDGSGTGGGGNGDGVTVAGVDVAVTPPEAGTAASPQGVELDVRLRLRSPQGVEPSPAVGATLELPAGTEIDGAAYPACDLDVLRRQGARGCPAGTIMGRGSVRGLADTSPAIGDVVVINGGKEHVWLATTLSNPVRVVDVIDGELQPLDGGGTRLKLTIPPSLQVVAGVPIALRELRLHAGRGTWLATTSCPADGRWSYRGEATFEDETTASYADAVPCS